MPIFFRNQPAGRKKIQAYILFTFVWVILAFSSSLIAGQPLLICTTDAPPVSTADHSGVLDRIVVEAFRRVGQSVSLVVTPSERGLLNANTGIADGDINRVAGLTTLYPNLVQVSEPNMVYEFMAFSRKSLVLHDWNSLAPYTVGFITGWKILEENVTAKSIIKVDNPQQLFGLLAMNRVDVVIYDRWGGGHFLRELQISDAFAVEPPLAQREMYLYLHTRHADLAPRLAEALRSMKADGFYQSIVSTFQSR